MEDDFNNKQKELNILPMEDNLNILTNGRQPEHVHILKVT